MAASVPQPIDHLPFMRSFARLCHDGWLQGWHERNGGNLSYRLTEAETRSCAPAFRTDGSWAPLDVRADNLAGNCIAVTRAGCYLRNVESDLPANACIVELDDAGGAYRVVWGLEGGGRPSSELDSHVLIHGARADATGGSSRVLYHAHPEHVIALTKVMPLDARAVTRALWAAMTECVMVFPHGVGVVECMVPGGRDIAIATSALMGEYDCVIWALHGMFAAGYDFDSAFGLMHTVEKAAKIHCLAVSMNGGSDVFPNTIDDATLRAIAAAYGLEVNGAFL